MTRWRQLDEPVIEALRAAGGWVFWRELAKGLHKKHGARHGHVQCTLDRLHREGLVERKKAQGPRTAHLAVYYRINGRARVAGPARAGVPKRPLSAEAVVDLLQDDGGWWSPAEVADWLGAPAARCSDLLARLHQDGVLAREAAESADLTGRLWRYRWVETREACG